MDCATDPELVDRIKALSKPCEDILFADAIATGGTPLDVAISADDATAYVSDSASGGNIFVIDTASSSSTITTLGPGPHTGIALNPAGTRLYVADDADPGSVTIGTPPP